MVFNLHMARQFILGSVRPGSPNNRPGADAGLTPLFACFRQWPSAAQAERWTT